MRERVLKIGQAKPLFGVLCESAQDAGNGGAQAAGDRVAVILLNSGVMHRIGSCRMTVKIARAITGQLGLPTLRFDFSGIGDSEARRGTGADFGQAAVEEVREVMDYLQQTQAIQAFYLYGLCSGAQISCQVALVDERVKGIAQIDNYSYATVKSYIKYYLPRIASAERWKARLGRLLGAKPAGAGIDTGEEAGEYLEVPDFADMPERIEVVGWLSGLVANNISLYSIHTGREPTYFYLDQYRDCFREVDFAGLLTLEYLPDASHIISQPTYQEQVVAGIVSWLSAQVKGQV